MNLDGERLLDILAGRTLGPYELQERLGAGGMGVVYRAVHRRLRQPRAVKILPAQLAADPMFVTRFEREARLAAELHHPNIVQIFDVGDHDGISYIAMELLEGRSLRQLILDERPLAIDRVLAILRQLADALDFAHEHGVAHRDVKPGNVVVSVGTRRQTGQHEQITLVDFGIARAAEEGGLTGTGALVGTAEYMAPEVIMGEPNGSGSDLYALGIVAYELVTGRVPFTGANSQAVMFAQVHREPPPPRTLRPDLPSQVEDVILRQLHKVPPHRYPTAMAFVDALAEAAGLQEAAPVPPPQPEPAPAPEPRPMPRPAPPPAPTPEPRPVPAPSPPPDTALPILDDPAGRDHRADSRISPPDPARAATHLLPDAERIPAPPTGDGDTTRVLGDRRPIPAPPPVPGRPRRRLSRRRMLALGGGAVIAAGGGWAGWQLYKTETRALRHWDVAITPDGRLLALGGEDNVLRLVQVSDGRTRYRLTDDARSFGGPASVAFAPDGQTVAGGFVSGTIRLWRVSDGSLLRDLRGGHSSRLMSLAFSPDGQLLLSGSGDKSARLWTVADGRNVRTLSEHADPVNGVAFSPDGRTVATASDALRLWQVSDGSPIRTLEAPQAEPVSVAFSPDGQLLAAATNTESGPYSVLVWKVSDGTPVHTLGGPSRRMRRAVFSPDGRTLASASPTGTVLWSVEDGRAIRTLSGGRDGPISVTFSADGGTLVVPNFDETVQLWRVSDGALLRTIEVQRGWPW